MKTCSKCDQPKPLTEFGNIKAFRGRRARKMSWCRKCVSDKQTPCLAENVEEKCLAPECLRRKARSGYCARHYKLLYRNGDPLIQKRATSTIGIDAATRKEFVREYKLSKGCTDCGYDKHWAALDFDHLPGTVKVADIRSGASFGWVALLEEIEKCDVVCANCHRIRTVERGRR